jgi:hypothetical protein
MEELRNEMRAMFADLTQQLMQTLQLPRPSQGEPQEVQQPDDQPEEHIQWHLIYEDLPAAPAIATYTHGPVCSSPVAGPPSGNKELYGAQTAVIVYRCY